LQGLPLRLFQRKIEIAQPLTQQQVNRAMQRLLNGQPICGEEGLPACDKIPRTLLARAMKAGRDRMEDRLGCVFRRGTREQPLPPDETRPFCDQQPPESLPCVFLPGPNDPPLPEDETRPLCPQLPAGTTLRDLRADNRVCVFRPRPGDPPLPASETRPFCPDPTPQRPARRGG
jgi:hypothetical protein